MNFREFLLFIVMIVIIVLTLFISNNLIGRSIEDIDDLSIVTGKEKSSEVVVIEEQEEDSSEEENKGEPLTILAGSEATIAILSDARPRLHSDGETQLIIDLNASDDASVIGAGNSLDAILFGGDMDYINSSGGTNKNNTEDAVEASDVANVPVFYVVGNHELDNPYDIFFVRDRFSNYSYNPNPGPIGTRDTTYSFDIGDMHIVVLNQYWDGNNNDSCDWSIPNNAAGDEDDACFKYNEWDGAYIPDELFDWLKEDLRESTQLYKIVLGHESVYPNMSYPNVRHVGDSLDQDTTNRDKFWNLLRTEEVFVHLASHTHIYYGEENEGVFEVNSGTCGAHVNNPTEADDFATILYVHSDDNDFYVKSVREQPNWSNPNITIFEINDIKNRTLVNTWAGAGSVSKYFIDRNNADEANPNWTSNQNSQWWLPAFDDSNWSDGELGLGYETTNPENWGWLNINLDVQNGIHATFQRVNFTIENLTEYLELYNDFRIGVDYDDAVIIGLNGEVIYRSTNAPNVSGNDIWDKNATNWTNANGNDGNNPVFDYLNKTEKLADQLASNINEGNNVLSIGNWNSDLGSSDLIVGVEIVAMRSFPFVTLDSPVDGVGLTSATVSFDCSAVDEGNLQNVTLYGTWNSGWHANETKDLSGIDNSTTFSVDIDDGSYEWNCYVCNDQGTCHFASLDRNFSIDTDTGNGGGNGGGGNGDGGNGGGGFISDDGEEYNVNNEELEEGYAKSLEEDDKLNFEIENESHYLLVKNITNSTIRIEIASEPQIAILVIGQTKKFDVNNDNVYDLEVRLSSIVNHIANVAIKRISQQVEEEDEIPISEEEVPMPIESKPILIIGIIVIFIVILVVIFFLVRLWYSKKKLMPGV